MNAVDVCTVRKRQVSGMDFYDLQDCCASCGAWFPRAGHVDMGRSIEVGPIPAIRPRTIHCIPSLEYIIL